MNKYNIGQTVYKITDGKITEHQILGMLHTQYGKTTEHVFGNEDTYVDEYYYQIHIIDDIRYQMDKNEIPNTYSSFLMELKHESTLFPSKEELIASL